MNLSIVTTMYHSASYLEEFYRRIRKEAEKITNNYEVIFVNDGSPDNSLEVALKLREKDDRIKVVDLSRNFGHHKAMWTGLVQAKGDLVFLIDCDLEEEPELFSKFYRELQESDADVVYGTQEKRKGEFFERFSGELFWKLFNLLSTYPVPPNQLVARLMSQRYVSNLLKHRDREVFLPGLWAITGFKQVPLTVRKRSKGSSTYTLRKKIAQFVDSITSFSVTPLVMIFYLGAGIVLLSSGAAIFLIVRRIFFSIYLAGWPSLIVSVWLLGGLTIFCIGLIGVYLSRIFMETKQRPHTIIRDIYEGSIKNGHHSKSKEKAFRHELQKSSN